MAPVRSLANLPEEMLIHIIASLGASSEDPMADLRSLRGVCSIMRDKVCGAGLVRSSLDLKRALEQSVDGEAIRERLIVNTHGAGNPEALFIMGIRAVFRQHVWQNHSELH